MSFTTQSSTAIGWANFLWDYAGGYPVPNPIDADLIRALNDAQNGTNGAVPGGTIYFPPLTGGFNYSITGTHTITGACALVSTGPQDVTIEFRPAGGVTTGSAFIITAPNVTMQGFTLNYEVSGPSTGSDNVAAIQVINTSGVLLRNLDITNAFGGVDCIGSSMECEWMHIRQIQDPGVSPQMAFGFRAQPGSLTGSSLDGLVMKLRRCEPHLSATGAAGFILASPYPEMAVQDSPASNGEFGFYVQAPTGSPTGNLGILRIRNSTAENDTYGLYADGGSVVQSSALMSDECKTASVFLTSNFSGVASLAGDHYVSLGVNAIAGLAIGTTGSASSAMVGLIGSSIGTDDSSPPTGIAGIFAALTSGGSLVANASAGHKLNRTVEVGASGAGSVSLVGVAAGATPNPLPSRHGSERNGPDGGLARGPHRQRPFPADVGGDRWNSQQSVADARGVRARRVPTAYGDGRFADELVGVRCSGVLARPQRWNQFAQRRDRRRDQYGRRVARG